MLHTMSKKIRGINVADLKAPAAKRWAEIASDPVNDGALIIMLSGRRYFLLGDDATAAAEALSLPLNGLFDPMFSFPRTEITSRAAQLRDKGLRVLLYDDRGNSYAAGAFWRATVEALVGNRKVPNVVSCAGLGVTGVGAKEVLTLNYTPGADVDAERVKAGIENLKSFADSEKSEFVICGYKLLTLELITP